MRPRTVYRKPLVLHPRARLLVAVALCGGCVELPPAGKIKLADAERSYRANDIRKATQTLDEIIREFPEYKESALAYYLRALCHERSDRVVDAGRDVQKCIALSTNRTLTAKARAMAGAFYFDSGNVTAAIEQYAKAIDGLPKEPPADIVRYRYGVCLQRHSEWDNARKQFEIVVRDYPSSQAASWARRMLEWRHDFFSVQCGVFRDRGAAASLAGRLTSARLNGWTESQRRDGGTMQVVFSGRYKTYEQAKAAVASVKRIAPDATVAP